MLIQNNSSTRTYTVGGVTIVPGAQQTVPDEYYDDIQGISDLQLIGVPPVNTAAMTRRSTQTLYNSDGTVYGIVSSDGVVSVTGRINQFTVGSGQSYSFAMKEGDYVRLTGDATAAGILSRQGAANTNIGTGTTIIGPFSGVQMMSLATNAGSIAAEVVDAGVTAAQVSSDGNSIVLPSGSARIRSGGNVAIAGAKVGLVSTTTTSLSDGVSTSTTSRISYKTSSVSAIADIQVEFWNGYISPTGEADGPNAITLNSSLEYNGVAYPLKLNGALLNLSTLAAGAKVLCDPVNIVIPVNSTFYIKTYVSVASAGMKWPVGRKPVTGEGTNGSNGADTSQVVGATGISAALNPLCPSCVTATYQKNPAVIILAGDSIGAGIGEAAPDANGLSGYMEKTLGITVPWFNISRGSTKLADFNTLHNKSFTPYVKYGTHAWFQKITNDVWSDGVNLAQAQARLQAAWAEASARGLKVIQSTCGPQTTGSWDSLANQTIADATKNANRIAINDWLRSMPLGVDVVLDTATVCESSLNSGKWRVDILATSDGLHPNTAMHNLLAAYCRTMPNAFL